MKGIILGLVLTVLPLGSQVRADECCKPEKVVTFKCMSPCDVLKGVGCYLKDTTKRSVKGAGMILSAPFKAEFCFPKPDTWLYKRARFKFMPPKWRRVPDSSEVIPNVEIFDGVLDGEIDMFGEPESESDYIPPLHYDSPLPNNFVNIISYKF